MFYFLVKKCALFGHFDKNKERHRYKKFSNKNFEVLEKSGKDKRKWTYCKQDRYTLSDVGLHQVQGKKVKRIIEENKLFLRNMVPKKTSFSLFFKLLSVKICFVPVLQIGSKYYLTIR